MIKKYYKNWKATIINSNYSLKDTIKNLNKTALRLCLVNKYNKFYGTVSDGDIRRALLRGIKLNDKIEPVVNKRP